MRYGGAVEKHDENGVATAGRRTQANVGEENWRRFSDQFPPQLSERLHNMYGV